MGQSTLSLVRVFQYNRVDRCVPNGGIVFICMSINPIRRRESVIAILATIAKQERARLPERVVAGLGRARRIGSEKTLTVHAVGQSVRAIAAGMGISKSLVANILTVQPS
jgi:hypothetical protein